MAGRSKGARTVAPRIRAALLHAFEGKGALDLHAMMRKSLENDFLGTLKAVAHYVPKELEATINDKRSEDQYSDAELEALIEQGSANIADAASSQEELH